MLKAKKQQIDQIEIPEELEMRLQSALNRKPVPVLNRFKLQVAALIVVVAMVTFNFDVIASYSKQLLGYDQVMNGTLKQLNELGKGQIIGKSYTFSDGVSLTIDYVMLDENQLLLFYTVKDPSGHVDDNKIASFMPLKTFLGECRPRSSEGWMNEARTEMKNIASFEPPSPFVKKLTLHFSQSETGKVVPAEISFTLNRSTAMGHTLKKDLNQTLQVDETKLKFDSILASPTKTVIKGSAESLLGLAMDSLSGERFRPTNLMLKLIANGLEVQKQGGGMGSDMKGITFHSDFDALPPDLSRLQIELVSFSADHDVNKQFNLERNDKDQVLDVLGQKVKINEINESKDDTFITLSSAESLILTKIYLIIDGKKIPLEETIEGEYDKADGTMIHKRTLRFKGTGDEMILEIQRMTYTKDYNQVIEVPLN